MSTTLAPAPDTDDLPFSQRVKAHFQPTPAAREVKVEPKADPTPAPAPAKAEAAPAPAPAPKATAKEEKATEPKEKIDSAPPASEDDVVFGQTAPKPAKVEAPRDGDFDKQLAEETAGMTPKAQAKWEKLRRSEKAAQEEAKAARAELQSAAEARQQAKESDVTPKVEALTAELSALKLQLEEAEKSLAVTNVERTKKFKREVGEPLGELSSQAKELADRYQVSPDAISKALALDAKDRNPELAELAKEFDEADRGELYQIGRDMERLRRAGEKLREKAKESLSALEMEEREAEEQAVAAARQTLSASAQRAWDEAAQTLTFLRPNAAAPEWTAALARARSQSESYVPGQDPITDGRIRALADQHPFLLKAREHDQRVIKSLTDERDALLARIEKENALEPALAGARHDDHSDDAGDTGEDMTLGQRVKAKVGAR